MTSQEIAARVVAYAIFISGASATVALAVGWLYLTGNIK